MPWVMQIIFLQISKHIYTVKYMYVELNLENLNSPKWWWLRILEFSDFFSEIYQTLFLYYAIKTQAVNLQKNNNSYPPKENINYEL